MNMYALEQEIITETKHATKSRTTWLSINEEIVVTEKATTIL